MSFTPVILAGGIGSRLWPLSRQQRPKQFLPLLDDSTLFQTSLQRLLPLPGKQAPIVVCHHDHRFIVAEQLREIDQHQHNIILEPVGRNTAPAVALAALTALQNNPDSLLLVLPADHLIRDQQKFEQAIQDATQLAKDNFLVTFGIVPTEAETGYGYIEAGELLSHANNFNPTSPAHEPTCTAATSSRRLKRFIEKPKRQQAQSYIQSSDFFWNSGMFMFRADQYILALEQFEPDILNHCHAAIRHAQHGHDFIHVDNQHFKRVKNISIDYAVMEKTQHAVMVPLDAGWSDIGSWSAIWKTGQKDANNNVFRGNVIQQDSTQNLVYAQNRLVSLLGVEQLLVVETEDALMVAHQSQAQQVKQIVDELIQNKQIEATTHPHVDRPWGYYHIVDQGQNFKVKRLSVLPSAKLSMQKHQHRAEHWIVVKGIATVTCDDKTFQLHQNQSTYIPIGCPHRLANTTDTAIELIEVQSGDYLEEDDITRFDDDYGR